MQKRILIISASFYPEQSPRSFRATELAKEFNRKGHHVTVFTYPNGNHKKFMADTGIEIEYLAKKKIRDISVTGGRLKSITLRLIRRALNLFFEYPGIQHYFNVKKKIRSADNKYDLLISIAVPHPIHWGVSAVWGDGHKIANTWIADCGDPYMYAAHDTFKKMFYFHYFENNFLELSDFVTVPFEEMKFLFNKKYRDKFRVIPQGFQIEDTILPEYVANTIPTFIYSGTVMPGSRDPFSLIQFLQKEGRPFRFVIYTRQKQHFSQFDDILGKYLFVKDYIPREALIHKLARADFLVNINTDSVKGIINAIPSKLIDYHISGRPILSYEQSKLPKNKVRQFMEGNYSTAFNDFDLTDYRIENVVSAFLKLSN